MEGGKNLGPDPCEIGPIDLSGLEFYEYMEYIHCRPVYGDLNLIHQFPASKLSPVQVQVQVQVH